MAIYLDKLISATPLRDVPSGSSSPDPFRGWDARLESQEIRSLYTPAMQRMIGADESMPGAGRGSYIPTPPWPGTEDAFDEPEDGASGSDFDIMQTEDRVDVFSDCDGGNDHPQIGDWMTDLAQQVVVPLAQSHIKYQEAKLAAKAAQRGYGPLTFGPQPAPQATPMVPIQQGPVQQAPTQTAPAFNWRPVIIGGVAVVGLIVALQFVGRRR